MRIENILELETRRKTYNYISKYPGLHLSELSRRLKIPKTTMLYHLNYLNKRELIKEKNVDNRTCYYVTNSIGAKDKELFNLMRKEIPRKIILILCLCVVQSQKDIVYFDKKWPNQMKRINFKMGKHHSTVSFHLKKLEEMGIIESQRDGNYILYKLKDAMVIIDFLVKYEGRLFDSTTKPFVEWMERFTLREEALDKFEKNLYHVFPNPYYC